MERLMEDALMVTFNARGTSQIMRLGRRRPWRREPLDAFVLEALSSG